MSYSENFKYLFPFEKIDKGSRIIIYGGGELGQAYWRQVQITNYCEMIGFVDRKYEQYKSIGITVFSPDEIQDLKFDYVLLAFRSGDYAKDVFRNLVRGGINEEKIIYVGLRTEVMGEASYLDEESNEIRNYAYNKECISIAMRYGAGLGDAIIKKGFFNEIASFSDLVLIDIYSSKAREFIDSFYSDCDAYNNGINDGGGLYTREIKKYDVSISVLSIPKIDYINPEVVKKSPSFFDRIMKLKQSLEEYDLEQFPFRNYGTHIRRMIFKKKNCYTSFNYTNDLHVERSGVTVPVYGDGHSIIHEYGLDKYMTFNYGTGMSSAGNQEFISKQWPKEYYERFVKLFKEEYSDIEIVQLGDAKGEQIIGADKSIFGESINVVEHILIHSLFHLDIEGGLVHLASQLGTKCIVLFGPTQVAFWGYPTNINIQSDKCHGCYGLYDVAYRCARNLDKPECMWSITPEMVMGYVKEYLNKERKTHKQN